MTEANYPTLAGVRKAADLLEGVVAKTPLFTAPALSRALNAEVWLKLETATPIASFKLRGAYNAVKAASADGALASAITSSTGNHGQGVAYAAALAGVPADIFLPNGAEPVKQAMIKLLGARLHVGGADIDTAKERARTYCEQFGGTFIDDGESVEVIEGAGTIGLEIGTALADVDHVFVPMGSGSLAAGLAIGLKGVQPQAKVMAVQSEGSPAMVESFRARRAIERPVNSLADCIHCRVPAALALRTLIQHVDDACLVTDRDLLASVHTLLAWGHQLVEPGAAAGLAAAWMRRYEIRGKRVVLVLSGANIGATMLARALSVPTLFDPTSA
jgi:threonine dehydratase